MNFLPDSYKAVIGCFVIYYLDAVITALLDVLN